MKLKVYGSSDDLIEIEGAIREEFSYDDRDGRSSYLAFSEGTVLRIAYSDAGIWRITPVHRGGAELTIAQAPEDDDDNYSDGATLTITTEGQVAWCLYGSQLAATKKP